jgi:hypothetical protein
MKRLQIFLLCMALMGSASAQIPTIQSVYQNPWVQVAAASGDGKMTFPRTFTFDALKDGFLVKKIILIWGTSPDEASNSSSHTYMGSVNEGVTWNSPDTISTSGVGDFDLIATIRRNTDGILLSVPFYWGVYGTPPLKLIYRTSSDNGSTWQRFENSTGFTGFPAGQNLGYIRFEHGIIQDADGTLYAPVYIQFEEADGHLHSQRSILMKSTNGGSVWNYVSTIQYTPNLSYTETAIVRCKDGSILAVMRNDPYSLKYQRSTNFGGTAWGTVNYLPGIPANSGVEPVLAMLPNGILALSYGDNIPVASGAPLQRHCYITFSADGNGNSWTTPIQTFTSGATPNLNTKNRSTGYTSIAPLRSNRFLQFSDRGDYRFYGNIPKPTPNPFSVWSKAIELVLNYKNRIDLKSKYATSDIAVSTDLTYTNVAHPEARISGAFDANTDYWNGAFKTASSGFFTIDLLKNHRINALAICLLKGREQSAAISYMADSGTTWTNIKNYNDTTHYTVDYTSFNEINARYIRVDLTSPSAMVGINEIVLFSSADTYEDYAYGAVPQGYTALDTANPCFWVSEGVVPTPSGYKSQRALFMNDNDGNNKALTKSGYSASATKTLEFKLRTKAFSPPPDSGCVQFSLMSGTSNVFHLAVFPKGVIKYYSSGWHIVGHDSVSVPLDTWKTIKVVANASTNKASVYVDGNLIGSNVVKDVTAATTINGFSFGSGGSAPVGDKALFDDVELYTTGSFPLVAAAKKDSIAIKPAMFIIVSPNPADNITKITVKNTVKGPLDLEIYGLYGKKLKSLHYMSEGNTFSVDIPVQEYGRGMYIITVKQNKKVVQTKLLK